MIDFAHSQNAKMGIQLAHAGRKSSTMRPWDEHRIATQAEGGWQSVSASDIAFEGYPAPRALTLDEIYQLTEQFADAAKRAVAVGFDVIEIVSKATCSSASLLYFLSHNSLFFLG